MKRKQLDSQISKVPFILRGIQKEMLAYPPENVKEKLLPLVIRASKEPFIASIPILLPTLGTILELISVYSLPNTFDELHCLIGHHHPSRVALIAKAAE
jgi:hypothetical protein